MSKVPPPGNHLKNKVISMIGRMETQYIQSIKSIRDKKTNKEIIWDNISIQKIITKYSNTNIPIFKLIIDDKIISRNNSYLIKYKCLTCSIYQEITLNLFMKKVNKNTNRCHACVNKEDNKREQQSQFMKDNASNIILGEYEKKEIVKVKSNSLEKHLIDSHSEWEKEDDDFKDNYFHIHLTINDFERIESRIIDVNNGKIKDLSKWKYEPNYRVYNQTKYTPMLVNMKDNQVEKPLYISFLCENCDITFIHRDLEVVKNKIKLFCKKCSFTNKTFRIRKLKLANGDNILWQSIFEKRFIEWCEQQNISIKNGPKIPYLFEDKQRMYHIDFELPIAKRFVELKDDHCWHKQQIESGKFAKKEESANEYAKIKGYKYDVVFPRNIAEYKNVLLKTL